MCVTACWSIKKRSHKRPSYWHYPCIEKDYVYDKNSLYFTCKKICSLEAFHV